MCVCGRLRLFSLLGRNGQGNQLTTGCLADDLLATFAVETGGAIVLLIPDTIGLSIIDKQL
jgi:hypothetical protein